MIAANSLMTALCLLAQSEDAGPPLDLPLPPPPPPSVLRHSRRVGDVELQVLLMARPEDGDRVRAIADEAIQEYARVLAAIGGPGGAVERLQENAGLAPIAVGPDAFVVISEAVRICVLAEGAFDPTAGVFTSLWPFNTTGVNQVPPPEELARRVPLVDCTQIALDAASQSAQLKRPGMTLFLADLPRGLALDRALALLRTKGHGDAIIHASGDLIVSGHKAGRRWMVGVQDPRGSGHFAAMPVNGGAVFTTGDYEQAFFDRGRRYHGVLDPRTGMPARGVRSVTVLASSGVEAAALSYAVFVLGPDKGMRLIERLPASEAVMVDDRNRVIATKGLGRNLKFRPPTDGP